MLRRDFIRVTMLLAAFPKAVAARSLRELTFSSHRSLVGGYLKGGYSPDAVNYTSPEYSGEVKVLDLFTREIKSIQTNCFAHSFAQSPTRPELVATTTKWARNGAVVDINRAVVVKELRAPDGMRFFGHGAFDSDGNLFLGAANDDDKQGFLLMYDPATWSLARRIPTGGMAPHDFFFVERATIVIVHMSSLNQPARGSMNWISVKDGRTLKKRALIAPTHLRQSGGKIFVGGLISDDNPGFFLYDPAKDIFVKPQIPASAHAHLMSGEVLNPTMLGAGLMASTTYLGHGILVWDSVGGRFTIKTFPWLPKGLVFYENFLWVINEHGKLFRFPWRDADFKILPAKEIAADFTNSSHMLLAKGPT